MIRSQVPFDPLHPQGQPEPSTVSSTVSSTERPPTGDHPVERILDDIRTHVARRGEICHLHTEEEREARHAEVMPALHPDLIAYLERTGIWPLWSHQGEAISAVLDGEHVVVASSTASGKTLCYNLPVLDSILRGENAYALYLYPTKALTQDQMRGLGRMIDELGIRAEAGIYDGDTEPVLRQKLRRHGRIVLTNPDMLHAAILPHHGGWAGLFSNLRYVVVDEMHTLRGIFGSHVANVIRRLRRIARHYGSDPIFIGATATIANPGEHAGQLLGLPVRVIAEDGSPRGRKKFVLWNPPLFERDDGTSFRKGAPSVAVRLLPELVRNGIKTICFGRARNTVELILRYIRERSRQRPRDRQVPQEIEAYRGGYLPSERRSIERRLFSGELGGVVATNALELGIDIGSLDGCIIAGWPGSVSSFLQQAGRAGRRADTSVVFLVAGQQPVDQFFMRHPEALFEKNPENATAEWGNPYILVRHLVCAAYELPLRPEDADFFGDEMMAMARIMGEKGKLRESRGVWHHPGQGYPAKDVKLRSASDENWTIFEIGADRIVGELDYVAGLFSLYEGAVYLHRTESFLVEEMDFVNLLVKIRRTESGYYTQALVQKNVDLRQEWESMTVPAAGLRVAEVDVVSRITGFKKVRFHTVENVGYGAVDVPALELDTIAMILDLDEDAQECASRYGPDFLRSGLHGLARLFREMLSIRAMCDPGDLDTFIDGVRIYIYDLYPGGIGYAEKGYEFFKEILETVLEAIADCPCAAGCPSCVLPGTTRVETYMEPSIMEFPYPKEATRFLVHLLLGAQPYVPNLETKLQPALELPAPLPPPLDPRTERKVRKAIGRIR